MDNTPAVKVKKPKLKLVGTSDNAFAILGAARRAARAAGWSTEQWTEFQKKATAGDYNDLLNACMDAFDVS